MNTKTLLSDAKARFNHNSAKAQLKDKYDSKLIFADQGGLWKVTPDLLGFLAAGSTDEFIVLVDKFENPVRVNRISLYEVLHKAYTDTMQLWYAEWKELESNR